MSFQFLDTPPDFLARIAELQQQPQIALDTEFMREQTYHPYLCLIQIAAPGVEYAVDPLALKDLSALSALLARPDIVKVLHAARQDVEVLLTRCPNLPVNLFDTQVAAALCGMPPQVGYGELVNKLLDVQLDKAHSRTDWSRRPLSAEQLLYAAEDVLYLLPLRVALEEKLEKLGRLEWFAAEMQRLADPTLYRVDPRNAWLRLKGLDPLDERRLAVAQALAQWREQRAMDRDRPRGWILADDALYEIVRTLPGDSAALSAIQTLPRGVIQKSGQDLLNLVAATVHLPINPAPAQRYTRPDAEQQKRLKSLAATVKEIAKELGMSPEVLATRRDLEAMIGGRVDIAPLKGWRRTVVGEALLSQL